MIKTMVRHKFTNEYYMIHYESIKPLTSLGLFKEFNVFVFVPYEQCSGHPHDQWIELRQLIILEQQKVLTSTVQTFTLPVDVRVEQHNLGMDSWKMLNNAWGNLFKAKDEEVTDILAGLIPKRII
jgi:hypothetical protein